MHLHDVNEHFSAAIPCPAAGHDADDGRSCDVHSIRHARDTHCYSAAAAVELSP